MTRCVLILSILAVTSCSANGLRKQYGELEEFHSNLLESNVKSTDLTARLEVTRVTEYESLPPLYVVYKFDCDVLEVFKGRTQKSLSFLHMRETDGATQDLDVYVGQTGIYSLTYNAEEDLYVMGDNGYDLPDTPHLLDLARRLMATPHGAGSATAPR